MIPAKKTTFVHPWAHMPTDLTSKSRNHRQPEAFPHIPASWRLCAEYKLLIFSFQQWLETWPAQGSAFLFLMFLSSRLWWLRKLLLKQTGGARCYYLHVCQQIYQMTRVEFCWKDEFFSIFPLRFLGNTRIP